MEQRKFYWVLADTQDGFIQRSEETFSDETDCYYDMRKAAFNFAEERAGSRDDLYSIEDSFDITLNHGSIFIDNAGTLYVFSIKELSSVKELVALDNEQNAIIAQISNLMRKAKDAGIALVNDVERDCVCAFSTRNITDWQPAEDEDGHNEIDTGDLTYVCDSCCDIFEHTISVNI